MASIICVRSFPARPTNGSPCASSSAPGPSPTNTSCAFGLPSPNTSLFRPLCSLQRVQSPRSSRIFRSESSFTFSTASNSDGPRAARPRHAAPPRDGRARPGCLSRCFCRLGQGTLLDGKTATAAAELQAQPSMAALGGAIAIKQANAQVLVIAEAFLNFVLQGFRNRFGHDRLVAGPLGGGLARQNASQPQRFIQDALRHFGLAQFAATADRGHRARNSVTIFVSTSKPAPSAVTSFATIKSAFFCVNFFRAFSATWSVSAANPTTNRSPFSRATLARMSGLGSSGESWLPCRA